MTKQIEFEAKITDEEIAQKRNFGLKGRIGIDDIQ
jgi:hypothetical protein